MTCTSTAAQRHAPLRQPAACAGLTQRFPLAQVSVWNLVKYNVAGGGNSALYGTEGPLFYAKNLFNAFNFALPLAFAAPAVRA